MILEEHVTTDGLLTLLVERLDDGDVLIGFEGLPWHTHPDLLVHHYGDAEPQALRGFISAILDDKLLIVVSRHEGQIGDAYIEDDPAWLAGEHLEDGTEVRYWSGRAVSEIDGI